MCKCNCHCDQIKGDDTSSVLSYEEYLETLYYVNKLLESIPDSFQKHRHIRIAVGRGLKIVNIIDGKLINKVRLTWKEIE